MDIMRNFKSEKLYNSVYQELRKYISTNKLMPGDKLPPEMELCEMLGVSRNVVREALKALQLMGVVNPVPGLGYLIQTFNSDKIFENIFYHIIPHTDDLVIEIFQINAALELQFFNEAFDSLTEEDINKLGDAYMEMERKILSKQRMTEPDKRFHSIIYERINNRMFHSIKNITWEMRPDVVIKDNDAYSKFCTESLAIHKRLYEALKIHDREAARKEIVIHYSTPPIGPRETWTTSDFGENENKDI